MSAIITYKFGGSSLASSERIRHVAAILQARHEHRQVVVVSAMQGVTNALLELDALASAGDLSWQDKLAALLSKHELTAKELLGDAAGRVVDSIKTDSEDLAKLLQALSILKSSTPGAHEWISGLGEVWSARMLGALLDCPMLDARTLLVVSPGELGVNVDWQATRARMHMVPEWSQRLVVTGFVARDSKGRATTLGRNGSDYSGAIFGVLFESQEIQIWTDVDGVLSADPKRVPEARVVERMSFEEAFELAYFGAKVIHPQTLWPAADAKTPIIIKNTFNPAHPGTRIDAEGAATPPIKGITCVEDCALVELKGAGMIGVPGTAERAFHALKAAQISVVMIAQASSEHSISCAIKGKDAERAVQLLNDAFTLELRNGQIGAVALVPGIALIAIVGDGMAGAPGTAARLFGALGRAGINVRAIAQGGSERNITVAIEQSEATRALRAVHAGFYLSAQTVSIGLIGPGQVGRALLEQLREAHGRLLEQYHVDLRIRAVYARRGLWKHDVQLTPEALDQEPVPGDFDDLVRHVQADFLPHAMLIDCSASNAVADHYPEWLRRGIHVVTPNKQLGAGDIDRYRAARAAMHSSGARFRYEATVGAGLPVISTLRDLLDTGDQVVTIEGIFSGTLGFLFQRFDGSEAFSDLVAQAKQLGYTEPDPRDDLRGTDVARKLTILARELGFALKLSEVSVESLVPPALEAADVDAFMAGLKAFDAPMAERVREAQARGHVLRYVARLDLPAERAEVKLVSMPKTHAFANTRATDNIVQFTTRRYSANPMIVQGPGAGPEVTAAGVFADILRIVAQLGAKL
jgi:aspartokinase/homoserine dehydrogenase 1